MRTGMYKFPVLSPKNKLKNTHNLDFEEIRNFNLDENDCKSTQYTLFNQ